MICVIFGGMAPIIAKFHRSLINGSDLVTNHGPSSTAHQIASESDAFNDVSETMNLSQIRLFE